MMCYTYYHYCYYYRKPISYNNNKIPCCETRCQNTVYAEHCAKVCQRVSVSVYDVRWSARVSISSKVNGSISYTILSLLVVDGGGDLLRTSGGERSEFSKTQYPPPTPWHRHKEAYLTHSHTHTHAHTHGRSVITIIHDRPDVTYRYYVCACAA